MVGGCLGLVLGTFSVFRYGHGGAGFFPTVGRFVIQSGASFGLFMGIGGLVRCDENEYVSVNDTKKILDAYYCRPIAYDIVSKSKEAQSSSLVRCPSTLFEHGNK